MKKVLTLAAFAVSLSTCAALPSLSGLAEQFTSLTERYADMTNRLAETRNAIAETRGALANAQENIFAMTNIIARIAALIEHEKGLREVFHGGHIGQYVLECGAITNSNGRIAKGLIRIDLYADGTAHTNAASKLFLRLKDPEAQRKAEEEAIRKADEIRAAWERANLPPELAAIREAQRQAAKTNEVTIKVNGN